MKFCVQHLTVFVYLDDFGALLGVLGADDAQIDDAVFDDQCSNSYVNYSNSRLREYSMFWAAAESDSDNKRNPAYEELQTLHSDDGRKSGLEETLDRGKKNFEV